MYTYHNTELTPDDIENIINDRFHLWKRNFYEVYNNFSMIMNDIVEFVKISEKLLDPVKTCTEELIHWTDVIDDIIFQIYNIYDPETTNKKKQNKEIISWNKKRQMNLENRRMEETKNLSNYMEISKYLQSAYQKYIVELQNENTDCCQNADYRNELTKINIFIRDIINKLIKTFNYYKYTNSDIAKSIENEIDVLMRISFDIYKNQQ